MSKLSAAHTRCYSAVVSLLLLLASATWAQPTVLNQQDWVLIKRAQDSESTRKSLDMTRIPNNPHQAQARQQANDLLAQLQVTNPAMRAMQRQHAANAAENHYRMLVFVSRSLGEAGLAEVLRAVSGQPDAVLVFRGVPEQMSFGQAVLTIQRMAASYDPVPNIMINPLLFTQYNVTAVPTIVMLAQNSDVSGHSLPALAQVSGLNDPAWLIREVRGGATGDLGVKGPVAAISEPDLIELAKTRMAKIDWAQKKQQALERFWRMQQFHSLAKATKARTRTVDPSVVVTKDIAAADGTVFVHAGTVMNPLCDPREVCLPGTRPFTQAVVVFDPQDHKQMALLAKTVPQIAQEPGVQRVIYVATGLNKALGWDAYHALTEQLQHPVYLLTPDLIARFELEYTPSVITARNTDFLVRELVDEASQ